MAQAPNAAEGLTPAPAIIVQGGGYSSMLSDLTNEYKNATKQSAEAGYHCLMRGDAAVDAVEAAVSVLEDNDYFNAGVGSLLNTDGEVECDAMIMDGETLNIGAVMSGRNFCNPVKLSRRIMDDPELPHCALTGAGAKKYARQINFPIVDEDDLISQHARNRVRITNRSYTEYVRNHYKREPVQAVEVGQNQRNSYDTVSAVAFDVYGHFACATSTGGIPGKFKGRVGDAPLVGCGAYANEAGGATTTGHGESIMKMTLARDVIYNMENGQMDAQDAADVALQKMKDRVDGHGGIIAIDRNGNFGKAFNTAVMVWASIKNNRMESGMEPGEVNVDIIQPIIEQLE